jgi:hypothetical protein
VVDDNGTEIELASSRPELVTICNTIVLAVTASNTAGSFLSSATGNVATTAKVIVIDPQQITVSNDNNDEENDVVLQVKCEADLLPIAAVPGGGTRSSSNRGDNSKAEETERQTSRSFE